MSDIHALSGAYAVDALDDDERTEFERHLEVCPECRAEVRSFSETAALIAETGAEAPPASLRESVLSGIGSIRPLPPETTPVTTPGRRSRSGRGADPAPAYSSRSWSPPPWPSSCWRSARGLVYRANDDGSSTTNLADRIMQAPDAVRVTEPVPGGGQLTIVRSASLKRAVMVGERRPAAEARHDVPDVAPAARTRGWCRPA